MNNHYVCHGIDYFIIIVLNNLNLRLFMLKVNNILRIYT